MPQNKKLQILINTLLYLGLFIAMLCMVVFLSQYRNGGLGVLAVLSVGLGALLLFLTMILILDFRNKIFETKTIWSRNLTVLFFFNLALSFALWAYTYTHIGYPEKDNQNGLWCLYSYHMSWGDAGWIDTHYLHPILGIIGLVISLITFCNIKYRLKRTDYYKTPIELFPIIILFILITFHYNHVTYPYNLG